MSYLATFPTKGMNRQMLRVAVYLLWNKDLAIHYVGKGAGARVLRGRADSDWAMPTAHGAHGCLRSAWSALRAASEDETGGPLTKVIEADVPPTRPGRGNARRARGGQ